MFGLRQRGKAEDRFVRSSSFCFSQGYCGFCLCRLRQWRSSECHRYQAFVRKKKFMICKQRRSTAQTCAFGLSFLSVSPRCFDLLSLERKTTLFGEHNAQNSNRPPRPAKKHKIISYCTAYCWLSPILVYFVVYSTEFTQTSGPLPGTTFQLFRLWFIYQEWHIWNFSLCHFTAFTCL